jgi:hypothetical protein
MAGIRYLFGYVLKGEGAAKVKLHQKDLEERNVLDKNNEIALYLSGRSFSAPEAMWRMSEYELVGVDPATESLPVHLPNEERILIDVANDTIEENLHTLANDVTTNCSTRRCSKLEAFFNLNQERQASQNTAIPELLYGNLSRYYVWDDKSCQWRQRQ